MTKNSSNLHIAIDLTPLRSGGENGGAKVLITTLLQDFPQFAPEFKFILLAAPWNYEELIKYENQQIKCCLMPDLVATEPQIEEKEPIKAEKEPIAPNNLPDEKINLKTIINRIRSNPIKIKIVHRLKNNPISNRIKKIPIVIKIKNQIKNQIARYLDTPQEISQEIETEKQDLAPAPNKSILEREEIDVLFCPFSATTYAEEKIPTISLVHDLQHLDYPFLFSEAERNYRNNFLFKIVRKAEQIICVSEFTRNSIIKHLKPNPERLTVIPNSIHDRFDRLSKKRVSDYLKQLNLKEDKYAFYPANYWPHKNHRILLTAYGIYRKKMGDRAIDLVFTGSLQAEEKKLKQATATMGLKESVYFLGYLPQEALTAVWLGCKCLVYPSFYEGFGIPMLEAMAFNKPIIASNACSLPEVGGDAAMYFDPRKPEELVSCLVKISQDKELIEQLVSKGRKRIKLFQKETMVSQYLKVFEQAANQLEISLN